MTSVGLRRGTRPQKASPIARSVGSVPSISTAGWGTRSRGFRGNAAHELVCTVPSARSRPLPGIRHSSLDARLRQFAMCHFRQGWHATSSYLPGAVRITAYRVARGARCAPHPLGTMNASFGNSSMPGASASQYPGAIYPTVQASPAAHIRSQSYPIVPNRANRGQSWSIVVNRGQSWSIVVNRGQSWSIVVNRGQSWSIVAIVANRGQSGQSWSTWSIVVNRGQS